MAGQNLTVLSFPLLASGVDLLEGNDRIWVGVHKTQGWEGEWP